MQKLGITRKELYAYLKNEQRKEFKLIIDCVSGIRGPVVTGLVETGSLRMGGLLWLVDFKTNKCIKCSCESIRMYGQLLSSCEAGDYVTILLGGLRISDVKVGMILLSKPESKENFKLKYREPVDQFEEFELKRQNSL